MALGTALNPEHLQGMEEVETNIRLSRHLGQMGPARAATKDALELSELLETKTPNADIKITKVTVVLPAGFQHPKLAGDDRPAIEGVSGVLPSADEAK